MSSTPRLLHTHSALSIEADTYIHTHIKYNQLRANIIANFGNPVSSLCVSPYSDSTARVPRLMCCAALVGHQLQSRRDTAGRCVHSAVDNAHRWVIWAVGVTVAPSHTVSASATAIQTGAIGQSIASCPPTLYHSNHSTPPQYVTPTTTPHRTYRPLQPLFALSTCTLCACQRVDNHKHLFVIKSSGFEYS